MAKWRHGLKIDRGATKQLAVLFNLQQEFSQPSHPLQQEIRLVSFFGNFASFQVNKCPLYGQMETGA